MYRSTQGASKARRDQINAEIQNLKELLPITDTDKSRLSYLHIMSLACMYTRKSAFFSQEAPQEQTRGLMPFHDLLELMHELSGFMLIVTGEGKLLYLSDNVVEHLGLGMVDLVVQSDSVYDIIDPIDHLVMRSILVTAAPGDTDRLFRCRFNTSKFMRRPGADNKPMLLRARYLPPPCSLSAYWTSNPVWVCFCIPLMAKPPTEYHTGPKGSPLTPQPEHDFLLASFFHSQHLKDMRLVDVQDSVTAYLGYEVDSLRSRSWYSLLHPRDLPHASAQHCALLREGGERQVEMVVQVEAADHSWVWLYMFLQLGRGMQQHINCNNYVISESEAWSLRQQLCWEQNHLAGCYGSGDSMNLLSSEALDSPERVFTPSSGGLCAQSIDFTTATSGVSFSPEVQSNLSSLEEESSTQTCGQWQWNPESIRLSSIPALNSSPVLLTELESDILTPRVSSHLANQSEPLPSSLTKLCAPVTMMGEFARTPTYTSHISSGCFSFDERLRLHLSPTAASCPQNPQPIVAPTITQAFSSDSPLLLLPTEYHRKMLASTDSFRMGGCNVMALTDISGPLYVPERSFRVPPEEVLTPERSPTTQRSMEKEQEREREDISLLARYIGSLVEGFYCDPLLPKQTSSVCSPSPTSPNSLCGCEFYSRRGLDRPLHHKDTSLYEESVLLEILIQDLCSSLHPLPRTPPPLTPTLVHPPQTLVSCCAHSHCNGEHTIGADHVSSVLSTQCNCRAVDGAMMLASGGVTVRNMEESPENMAMDVSPPSTSLTASQEPASVLGLARPARTHGLRHAQFLMEELAAMDQVFEAGASISPFWGDNLSCINSRSTIPSRRFHQGGSLRDPTF